MSHLGVTLDIYCLLCDNGIDDIQHIMVDCYFTNSLKMLLYGKHSAARTWEQKIHLYAGTCTRDSLHVKREQLKWRAWISMVWYERCRRNAGVASRTPEELHSVIIFNAIVSSYSIFCLAFRTSFLCN
ncbi:hypothetical protein LINPERPRIM_LOCUS37210 [Linum perenne]